MNLENEKVKYKKFDRTNIEYIMEHIQMAIATIKDGKTTIGIEILKDLNDEFKIELNDLIEDNI